MPMTSVIPAVAVAAPATTFEQPELLELLGLEGDEFAEGVFARCGVTRRHLELTPELLRSTLQERTARTERQLLGLAAEAVEALSVDQAEVGVVVTGSYYSLGGPTLAHRLIDRFDLPPDVDKYHLVGAGCASAVPLFRLASQALRDRPGQRALVVAAESLTGLLTWVGPDAEKVKVVGSSLFGDGCGVALLAPGAEAAGPAIVASAVHQIPGTLDHVRLVATADDSQVQMSRELPAIAANDLRPLVDAFLQRSGVSLDAIDHWLVHPGGRGILDGIQEGLGLDDVDTAPSRAVLAEYGNVGTPSALFVLEETVRTRAPRAGERGLMVTIGPGVTVGLMLLRW